MGAAKSCMARSFCKSLASHCMEDSDVIQCVLGMMPLECWESVRAINKEWAMAVTLKVHEKTHAKHIGVHDGYQSESFSW